MYSLDVESVVEIYLNAKTNYLEFSYDENSRRLKNCTTYAFQVSRQNQFEKDNLESAVLKKQSLGTVHCTKVSFFDFSWMPRTVVK